MNDVLFVSKPVAPPWNDSNKNLVRDVSRALTRYRARVMVPRDVPLEGVANEPLYATGGNYAPSRWANARVLARLIAGPTVPIWHFFFAPNPLTLRAGALAARVRGARTVHTIASAPDDLEHVARHLFADRIITLSQHTTQRLRRIGIAACCIPPALSPVRVDPTAITRARETHRLPARYVLFPGDLEFGDAARTFVRCAALDRSIGWVVASRPKTERAHAARAVLESEARELGAAITWLGALDDIHAVVAGARVVALASNTLHAKMDWPLVLLEAMALGVPIIVAESTAAAELCASPSATSVRSGDAAALLAAVNAWESRSLEARARAIDDGQRWVDATCSPATIASAHEDLYDTLLDSPRSTAREV